MRRRKTVERCYRSSYGRARAGPSSLRLPLCNSASPKKIYVQASDFISSGFSDVALDPTRLEPPPITASSPSSGSSNRKPTRQAHDIRRIHALPDRRQPRRIRTPVELRARRPRDGVIRVRGEIVPIDAFGARHALQKLDGRLHRGVPERVLARVRPREVQVQRERGALVRERRVRRVLAVRGEEGLEVVGDGGAGVPRGDGAVVVCLVLHGVDEGRGERGCRERVEGAAGVGHEIRIDGADEGGEALRLDQIDRRGNLVEGLETIRLRGPVVEIQHARRRPRRPAVQRRDDLRLGICIRLEEISRRV